MKRGDEVEIKRGVHAGRKAKVTEVRPGTWAGGARVGVELDGKRFSLAWTSVKKS